MAWQTPKTDWDASDSPVETDFNRIEGNTLELYTTKLDKTGGAISATLTVVSSGNSEQVRNVSIGTAAPDNGDGADGDIYVKYTA